MRNKNVIVSECSWKQCVRYDGEMQTDAVTSRFFQLQNVLHLTWWSDTVTFSMQCIRIRCAYPGSVIISDTELSSKDIFFLVHSITQRQVKLQLKVAVIVIVLVVSLCISVWWMLNCDVLLSQICFYGIQHSWLLLYVLSHFYQFFVSDICWCAVSIYLFKYSCCVSIALACKSVALWCSG